MTPEEAVADLQKLVDAAEQDDEGILHRLDVEKILDRVSDGALPTEPYTVIRAWLEGADEPRVYIRSEGGIWFRAGKRSTIRSRVLRFEILAQPQAVTADAVLDEVRPWIWGPNVKNNDYWHTAIDKLGRRFGVVS